MTGSAWNSFLPPQKCPTSLMGTVTPGDSLFLTLMCTTWYLLLSSLHFTYTCAYTQGKGLEHGYSYTVKSVSSDYQYTVHMLASQCSYGNECIPHCTQGKCSYLCRHMISCTCYDFSHGHLCKHVHKVCIVTKLDLKQIPVQAVMTQNLLVGYSILHLQTIPSNCTITYKYRSGASNRTDVHTC